jgi:hypothetical protein
MPERVLPLLLPRSQPGPSPSFTPGCKKPQLLRAYRTDCAFFRCFYYLLLLLTTCCLCCPAGFDNHGKLLSTVRFNTTRGEDRVDGLGVLSLHGKQFMRAHPDAIARSEGHWRANLANRCNRQFRQRCEARPAAAMTLKQGKTGTTAIAR